MSTSYPSEGGSERPVQAVAVNPYAYPPARPKKSVLGKIFLAMLLIAFFGSILLNLLLVVAVGVRGGGGRYPHPGEICFPRPLGEQ